VKASTRVEANLRAETPSVKRMSSSSAERWRASGNRKKDQAKEMNVKPHHTFAVSLEVDGRGMKHLRTLLCLASSRQWG
jgi:hypothetical protein